MSEVFLTEAQVDELTGIRRGHTLRLRTKPEKLSKYQRQVEFLRGEGFAFFTNARGRPIVTRAAIEGSQKTAEKPVRRWLPEVLRAI
ncbi:Uncharacterized protein MCB1EB_0397 [Mycoavidus cysteinexigens]|uniref:DUF4224 domain-containing protein n=1 Tax=Mycoavidus cysteinexigens TaxID=1553431 RepID=A0A2Z6ET49_9BURK|nr:DUF4224 domain-containing protein [Mycoavidus cysteinexigens]BBE08558.1 Uncharacterized protein MCB1EB_0397 [Mycoavidus cysteinexigens]GAM52739.1 hypothetical protein EBME_1202 [bacterium endosymbiont of Mortierella elongata FMR23-6]GLR00409.1 hypothetical protein GCM10007934_02200 [Mycoavidus cysteinexigens]